MSDGERKLAAIMFTDMVGYTALGQRNESLSLALVDEQRKLLRPIIARHSGKEIKTIGDAFLVEFHSALEAVRCAYDLQRVTREFNITLPSEKRIHLRVGVHLGDVVESQGDISGDAVNIASRIESLAEDGGVCITRQVYDHVQNKFELPLESLGTKPLKNVSVPLEIYRMVMPWAEEKSVPPAQLDKRRVAILPFASLSPDPNDGYFADGMTEELISTTSSITGLTLIARTSVMGYKGTTKKIEEIGRELSVGTVLEGSVRKAANRLRITVQLIDVQSQGHLWAQSYDRDFDDVFAVQSDIARRVAEALKVRLMSDEVRALEKKPTRSTYAYALYVRAMQLSHELTEPSLREAIELFNRAVSDDQTFARAYAGLSRAWWSMAGVWEDLTAAAGTAEVAALKALELDPNCAEAHASMSAVHFLLDRYGKSITEAKRAVEINPSLSDAYLRLGLITVVVGKLDQALAALQRAFELDPLSVDVGLSLAPVYDIAGGDGLAILQRMKELEPKNPLIYALLASHYLFFKHDYVRAQEMLDAGLATNPKEFPLRLVQGELYALSGKRKEAHESLDELRHDEIEAHRLSAEVDIKAALGDLDGAFKALFRQVDAHSVDYRINYHPLYEEMRKDPRFREYVKVIGIAPSSTDNSS